MSGVYGTIIWACLVSYMALGIDDPENFAPLST